jgi:2-polyprenyl-3-methyl-5-hydroxy-6-metoxy-1,4-benzoquinol methylase
VEGYRRVLDIGCGPGTFIGALGDDHECLGIDISEQQIGYARQRYESPTRSFRPCRVTDLPDDVGTFDAVTAVELIEQLSP